MDTSQAISEAKRWTNTFRAFEHIEEVLSEVHAAKGVLSDVKVETERLNEANKKAKSTLKSKENALGAFLELEAGKRARATRDALAMEADLKKNLDEQRKAFKQEIVQRKETEEAQIADREKKLTALNVQLNAVRGELSTLQTSIMGLQSQVKGLRPEA